MAGLGGGGGSTWDLEMDKDILSVIFFIFMEELDVTALKQAARCQSVEIMCLSFRWFRVVGLWSLVK